MALRTLMISLYIFSLLSLVHCPLILRLSCLIVTPMGVVCNRYFLLELNQSALTPALRPPRTRPFFSLRSFHFSCRTEAPTSPILLIREVRSPVVSSVGRNALPPHPTPCAIARLAAEVLVLLSLQIQTFRALMMCGSSMAAPAFVLIVSPALFLSVMQSTCFHVPLVTRAVFRPRYRPCYFNGFQKFVT